MQKVLATTAAAMFIATACTTAPPAIDMSPEAEVTFDGLRSVVNTRADAAWARPDADLSGYTKVMLQGAGIEYRPGGESGRTMISRGRGGPYEVTEEAKARLQTIVVEAFADELGQSDRFELVQAPGPDVLLVRGALLDVVSYVPPDPIEARSSIFLTKVGEATLVVELRDSITEAILARALDRRAAEQPGGMVLESNRVSNAAEVRRLANRWARQLREALEGFMG